MLRGYRSGISVFEVSSCPTNESLWREAAKKLGCNLKIEAPFKYFYYCIPTTARSRLVEFCYDIPSEGQPKNTCLELGTDGFLHEYDCSHFVTGCPPDGYLGEEIYKHQACLQLNTQFKCYLAANDCSQQQSSTVNISSHEQSTWTTPMGRAANTEDSNLLLIITGVAISTIFLILILAVGLYLIKRTRCKPNASGRDTSEATGPLITINQLSKKENLIARTKALIRDEIKKMGDMYVQTAAFRNSESTLRKQNYVLIKGNPGDGKTAMAIKIINILISEGKQPIRIKSPSEWDETILPNENLVIFIDNILGEFSMSHADAMEWSQRFHEMRAILKSEIGRDNYLLLTIRNDIYEECTETVKDDPFLHDAMVDISCGENKLTPQEKINIFNRYVPNESGLFQRTFNLLKDVPDLGFPQCCRLYYEQSIRSNKGLEFFRNPLHFLKQELEHHLKNKDMKFAVLVYILMEGGEVGETGFDYDDSIVKSKIKMAMNICEIKEKSFQRFQNSVHLFMGSFITKDSLDEKIRFTHSSIHSSLFLVLGKTNKKDVLENCNYTLLRNLTTKRCPPCKIDTLRLTDSDFDIVILKLHRLLQSKEQAVFTVIAELILWHDDVFYNKYLQSFKDNCVSLITSVDENGNSMLVHFASAGNIRWVKCICDRSYVSDNCNQRYEALNAACAANHMEIIKYLLNEKVEPDIKTCFHAVISGEMNLISLLVKHGVNITSCINSLIPKWRHKTLSVVGEACNRGHSHLILSLLNEYPELKSITNEYEESSIHFAAYAGAKEALQILIEEGKFDPFLRTCIDSTILHFACQNGELDTFMYIAESQSRLLEDEYNDSAKGTLLHRAAEGGSTQIFQILVNHGKDINCRKFDGKTVLHRACENQNMVKYLVDKYPHLLEMKDNESRNALHDAANCGNIEAFKFLLHKGLSVNNRSFHGTTVLHQACSSGQIRLVEYLLCNYGDMISGRDKNGRSPLFHAARSGEVELFKYLVDKGFDARLVSATGETVLHYASAGGHLNMCQYIIKTYNELLHMKNNENATVIHYAASGENFELFKLYVEKGLDPRLKTKKHETILHFACKEGKGTILKDLIQLYPGLVDKRDVDGHSFIHVAATNTFIEHIEDLLPKNLNIYHTTTKGANVLHIACSAGRIHLYREMIRMYKDLDILDIDGKNVLHYAASSGSVHLMKYLITGRDIACQTKTGKTVLHFACQHRCVDMCNYLLNFHIQLVSKVDHNGESALHDAAFGGNKEVYNQISEIIQNPLLETKTGKNVLHFACLGGSLEMCQYLINSYPKLVELKDNYGITALHDAVSGGNIEVVDFLITNDHIKAKTKAFNGQTFLHAACEEDNMKICKYIVGKYPEMLDIADNKGRKVLKYNEGNTECFKLSGERT